MTRATGPIIVVFPLDFGYCCCESCKGIEKTGFHGHKFPLNDTRDGWIPDLIENDKYSAFQSHNYLLLLGSPLQLFSRAHSSLPLIHFVPRTVLSPHTSDFTLKIT